MKPSWLLLMAEVVFVYWSNICHPPMMEWAARGMATERGLDMEAGSVDILSEETGNPIDRRTAVVLREAGCSVGGYRARRVTADDLASADLVIVAERSHIDRLEQLCLGANYALINDLNPTMPKGQDLDDPWYGPTSGSRSTLADIEAAMPRIPDAFV